MKPRPTDRSFNRVGRLTRVDGQWSIVFYTRNAVDGYRVLPVKSSTDVVTSATRHNVRQLLFADGKDLMPVGRAANLMREEVAFERS